MNGCGLTGRLPGSIENWSEIVEEVDLWSNALLGALPEITRV